MKRWFFVPEFVVVLLLLTGCASSPNTSAPTPPQVQGIPAPPTFTSTEIAMGEAIYADNCASCHGVDLEGEAQWKIQNEDDSFRSPPHSADGHTWHHADSILIESIKEGGARFEGLNIAVSSNMPAFSATLPRENCSMVTAVSFSLI